jgi:hypothetical protein
MPITQQQIITYSVVILTILLLLMYLLSGDTLDKSTIPPINQSTTTTKVDCTLIRTPCDKTNPTSCNTSCNNSEEMKCIDLDDGSGSVCLPDNVDVSCNTENGGMKTWTGYGFTESQGWACLCTHPEYFSGSSCNNRTPSFCTNGTLDLTKKWTNDMCVCPSNSVKMYREYGNTPFCVEKPPANAPINYIGNYVEYPNWQNIYYNPNPTSDKSDWAKKIVYEMTGQRLQKNDPIVMSIINILDGINLNADMASKISKLFPQPNLVPQTFNPSSYIPEVTFSYYDNNII